MLLADAGITVWIVGLFVIGILGFVVSILTILFRVFGRVLGFVFGSGTKKPPLVPPSPPANRICPHTGCGHANQPTALYCARCGQPLRKRHDVDAYG